MLKRSGHVIFGRKHSIASCPHMKLSRYMGELELPSAPTSVDYTSKAGMSLSNVYLNDRLGDCVIAGGYHVEGVLTANCGKQFIASQQQIINDYKAIGGYVPGDPNTDNGCDLQTAMNYWTKHGFANGTKLSGWLGVNAADKTQVQTALWLFENLYMGIDLPDAWVNPFPSGSGFVWDIAGPIDPNNGHCIMASSYNTRGVTIDTWGMLGTMTYEALAAYATSSANGELYVLLSPDQVSNGMKKAPNGFDWVTLIADFDAMGGTVPIPSPPKPVSTTLTLAQVQALLTANWPK